MKGLTKRQSEVFSYIRAFIDTNSYAPSFREIQTHFKFASVASVHKHINVLKRKGLLQAEPGCSRSLSVETFEEKSDEVQLPFFGYLSEEAGIETFPQIRTLGVPATLVPNPEGTYILRAKGEAIKRELIAQGDLLIVETRQFAETGELVIVEDEEKRIYVQRFTSEQNRAIHGVIITLVRLY